MLWLVAPVLDWEEREHLVGALGGLVDIGLSIWNAFRGEKKEEPVDSGDVAVQTEGGPIPLCDLLKNHEERLQAVEQAAQKAPRRSKK